MSSGVELFRKAPMMRWPRTTLTITKGRGDQRIRSKKLQHAMHWLQKALASGTFEREKIEHADEEEGIKEHTLRRAARELKISLTK